MSADTGSFPDKILYRLDLIGKLVWKDFIKRYKQKYLKWAWPVIHPMLTIVIFTAVFSKVAKIPSEGVPYPLFAFTALAFWNFFSSSVTGSTGALVANTHLITHLNFPRMTLAISSVLVNLIDLVIALILLAILFWAYGFHFSGGQLLLFLIPVFIIQLVLTIGMALIFSIGNVFVRDINSATGFLMHLWMLASPVIYPVQWISNKNRIFYLLNPMTGILDSYRKILLHHEMPNFFYLSVSTLISLAVFAAGYILFKKCDRYLADVL